MAWHFDETSGQHVTLGDNPALNMPDGDWTIAGWIKLDDNVGDFYQHFLSMGIFNATPSWHWYFHEASVEDPNVLHFNMVDDDGANSPSDFSAGTPGTSTIWQHLILRRSGTTVTQYINGSADGADTNTNFDAINAGLSLYVGMRSDNDNDRRLGGSMAEWAKWNRALGAGERAALVAGYSPKFFLNSLMWYVPMVRPYQEIIVPLTVTNNNSTVSAHPPIIYPTSPRVIRAVGLANIGKWMGTTFANIDKIMGASKATLTKFMGIS